MQVRTADFSSVFALRVSSLSSFSLKYVFAGKITLIFMFSEKNFFRENATKMFE